MKKIKIFGLLILAFALVTVILSAPLYAENAALKIYEQQEQINQAMTASKNPDNLKASSINTSSSIIQMSQLMFGAKFVSGETAEIKALPPYLREAGLVPYTVTTMVYSFFEQPDMQVGSHYAQMFLPKEFYNQSAGSLYASGDKMSITYAGTELEKAGISKLWTVSFGLSLIVFIVVIVVAGFMVMFRSKLGGQSVVTITMALQNILVGIFMAVSSYAIGGFFITLSKFFVLGLGTAFAGQGLLKESELTQLGGPGGIFMNGSWTSAMPNAEQIKILAGATLITTILGIVGGGGGIIAGLTAPYAIFMLIQGAFGLLVLIASLKIFFTVFSTYIKMVLDIILAPVVFVLGSLPGRGDAYMSWVKRMFKNALVAPMIFLFVNIATYAKIKYGASTEFLASVTGGAMRSDATDILFTLIGPGNIVAVILLLMAPSAPSLLEEMFSGKAMGAAEKGLQSVRDTAGKIPVVGGFISGK